MTATACQLPRTTDVPLARWSRAELARRVAHAWPHTAISASTIGRWLAAERLRPWRYRMWQHIHDPVAFLARARPILDLYHQAPMLLQTGTWVVCIDEKTSIQAREAEQAPQPAIGPHGVHQSPRYHRRGARHLIAGLSVADGQIVGQCTTRKRFVEFQTFLTTTLIPEARRRGVQTVVLIVDNGPTHAPKQLERWLHDQAAIQGWGIRIQVAWLPKNASWLDQIEIWFSVLQRKLLQPNHFTSTDDLTQAIAAFMHHYNQTAKPIRWTYTSTQLEQKLGSYL